MTDDKTIDDAVPKAEPKTDLEAVSEMATPPERSEPPVRRKSLGAAAILMGFITALCAGGLGGFAAHEYFKTPLPDIPDVSQDIKTLEKTVSVQAAQVKQLEARSKAKAAKAAQDLKALEDKWQEGLRLLDDKIKAVDSPAAVPVNESSTDDPAVNRDGEGDNEAPLEIYADPRPELLAAVETLRRRIDEDITAVKTRLERLESQSQRAAVEALNDTLAVQESFPLQDILNGLEDVDAPDEAQNWWNKALRKHITVKRTARAQAAARLRDIEAAILIQDWEQALSLSGALPEPAREAVQEWIARARR